MLTNGVAGIAGTHTRYLDRATKAEGSRQAKKPNTSPLIERGPLAGLPKKPSENRAEYLTKSQLLALGNAFFFAERLSHCYRLNVGLTLLFDSITLPARKEGAVRSHRQAFTAIMRAMSQLMAKQGHELAFIYVWENAPKKGEHVHAMLHVPNAYIYGCLKQMLRSRFNLRDGNDFQFSLGSWKNKGGKDAGRGMQGRKMREGFMKYLLKGHDPEAFGYYGGQALRHTDLLGLGHQRAGRVSGKRCGASENLGPAARRRAGWVEIRDLGQLGGLLHQHSDTSDRAGKPFGRKKDDKRPLKGARKLPGALGARAARRR